MAFAHLSYLAVFIAAATSFVVGALWYGALGKPWMAALGWSEAEIKANTAVPVAPMIIAFVAELIMAFVLAGVIGHLGPGAATIKNGLISGAFIWAGFIVTTLVVNTAYARRSWMLALIDAGHWLAVLLAQVAVLGAIG